MRLIDTIQGVAVTFAMTSDNRFEAVLRCYFALL